MGWPLRTISRRSSASRTSQCSSGVARRRNVARNTVTVRSNYMRDASIPFYVKSVSLYENLTRELNFNTMYSKRSMIDVLQSFPKVRDLRRRQLNMDIYGANYERISTEELRRRIPALTGGGPNARLPIVGGMVHGDAGVNRHDAVAWGYARAADARGVELHQQTPVTKLLRGRDGAIEGVETTRGTVHASKVAVAVSGHTTTLTETIGLKLPLRTMNLTAFVSETCQAAGGRHRQLPGQRVLFQPIGQGRNGDWRGA